MSGDAVTVAVVAKNESKNILPCLDAIYKLEGEVASVLLVDSSDDDTVEKARSLGAPRLKVVRGDFCVGRGRYEALSRASTRYCLTVDADAVLEPDSLTKLLARMKETGAVMVGPRVTNPMSRFPGAWFPGDGYVDFMTFTTALIDMDAMRGAADGYKDAWSGEDAYICRELTDKGGRLFIDSQVHVEHNYPVTLGRLLKKAYWYGQGEGYLFHLRRQEPLMRRLSLFHRSGFVVLTIALFVIFALTGHWILAALAAAAYFGLQFAIYIRKFGIVPGMYRGGIEVVRAPAWAAGTFSTTMKLLLGVDKSQKAGVASE